MSYVNPDIQSLAGWLVAHEECVVKASSATACICVCDKLRKPLSTLAGADGYKALISRALALAKAEAPRLASMRVREDGTLEAPGPVEPGRDMNKAADGDAELVVQLLGLLVTFIGEALTTQMVRDVWPNAPVVEGIDSNTEKP